MAGGRVFVGTNDFELGDPAKSRPLPPLVAPTFDEEHNQFVLRDEANGGSASTQV